MRNQNKTVAIQVALLFGCALILVRHEVASGLRITSIEVPSAVMNSSQATLACNYELQGDQLYSVKWYKNYVEFYRFQPSQVAAAQDSQQQQQQQQLSFGSKQEFELEGINLNLSRSNATHVHLKQTSLSSEGTYKCEISADSPSFATISSERQMKVYVLPRQKVSIVDNTKQQLMSSSNPNDLVNLTCISSASSPVAKLRWFINDAPLPNSSKWLFHNHQQNLQQQSNRATSLGQNSQQPMEARLTLAFRYQPNLVAQMMTNDNQTMALNGNNHKFQSTNKQQLEFKCVAELSLEFVAETSIAVAGGKTTQLKKRNRDQPIVLAIGRQSVASPLIGQVADNSDHLGPINFQSTSRLLQTGVVRLGADAESRPLASVNRTIVVAPVRHQQSQQQQGVVVLTNKQLRPRAEQIEQMLHFTRPNDLQPPLIEARSQPLDYADSEADETGDVSLNEEKLPANASEDTGTDEDPLQLDGRVTISTSIDNNHRDYQLNELVLFTCSVQPAQMANLLRSNVHFRWLINNKDINSNHISHYDGDRFHLQQSDQKLARKNKQSNQTPSQSQQQQQRQQQQLEQSSLLIEFTPSLFQLKELDLKCRTSIVQPLIEYETILLTNTPSNVGQQTSAGYIEADSQTGGESLHSTPRGQHNRPWMLKQHSQQQQRRNQVLRLQKQQQQHSSSSSSSFSLSTLLQPIVLMLNLLIVARVGQTR